MASFQLSETMLGGLGSNLEQFVFKPERADHLDRIRPDLQSGADLTELRRLLVDLDLETEFQKRRGGGESADPGADDDDLGLARHVILRNLTLSNHV